MRLQQEFFIGIFDFLTSGPWSTCHLAVWNWRLRAFIDSMKPTSSPDLLTSAASSASKMCMAGWPRSAKPLSAFRLPAERVPWGSDLLQHDEKNGRLKAEKVDEILQSEGAKMCQDFCLESLEAIPSCQGSPNTKIYQNIIKYYYAILSDHGPMVARMLGNLSEHLQSKSLTRRPARSAEAFVACNSMYAIGRTRWVRIRMEGVRLNGIVIHIMVFTIRTIAESSGWLAPTTSFACRRATAPGWGVLLCSTPSTT